MGCATICKKERLYHVVTCFKENALLFGCDGNHSSRAYNHPQLRTLGERTVVVGTMTTQLGNTITITVSMRTSTQAAYAHIETRSQNTALIPIHPNAKNRCQRVPYPNPRPERMATVYPIKVLSLRCFSSLALI